MALYYFIADSHLGLDYKDPKEREKKFASFLESLPEDTKEVYLLGDIFDFWFEYKDLYPAGFARTLGAIASLIDRGVKVHFFNGNHDIWTYRHLQNEIGVIMEKQPLVVEIEGQRFCLGHGDGLWHNPFTYRVLQWFFKCRFNQVFWGGIIPPRWFFKLGHSWSKHNRLTRFEKKDAAEMEQDTQNIKRDSLNWAEEFQKQLAAKGEKPVDHFIFGHFHTPFTQEIPAGGDLSILGDWIHNPDYLLFNGTTLKRITL